jgi:hypothetical protein
MMKRSRVWPTLGLTLGLFACSAQVWADPAERADRRGDRIEHRLDQRGDRVDRRLDRRGSGIDRRMDRRGARRA